MHKLKAHVSRWKPRGCSSITAIDIDCDSGRPISGQAVLKTILSDSNSDEYVVHGDGSYGVNRWCFIITDHVGQIEFINILVEDAKPDEVFLQNAAERVNALGEAIREAEMLLSSRKYQYGQAVAAYKKLQPQ